MVWINFAFLKFSSRFSDLSGFRTIFKAKAVKKPFRGLHEKACSLKTIFSPFPSAWKRIRWPTAHDEGLFSSQKPSSNLGLCPVKRSPGLFLCNFQARNACRLLRLSLRDPSTSQKWNHFIVFLAYLKLNLFKSSRLKPLKPRRVVVNPAGLWSRRRGFESLRG